MSPACHFVRNLTIPSNLPVDGRYHVSTLRAVLGVVDAGTWFGEQVIQLRGVRAMRKFLMVAALVAVAACGKKQGDTGSMEATGAAAGAAIGHGCPQG
jgi:hypothetical protein